MEICLITNLENKWGLSKDTKILKSVLEKYGHHTYTAQWNKSPNLGKKFHINLHLELVAGKHFTMGRRNMLIPNQEWFLADWTRRKNRFDKTLCKTALGANIFQGLGFRSVTNIGFTSEDRFASGYGSKKREFYHLAGNSLFKNTKTVIDAWVHNPKWPKLHVFGSNPHLKAFRRDADNIEYTFKYVSDNEILAVQNTYWFAVQPSVSEGYGHCITEPLSTGGLVIGIDAPPMNEFPAVLRVPAKQYGDHHYGQLYIPTDFNIEPTLALTDSELKDIGEKNRTWWETNVKKFETNLIGAIA